MDYEVSKDKIDKLCNDIFEYRKLKNSNVIKPTIQNLLNWKLLIKDHDKYIATNAFVILTQEDDTYFPYSKIQCARFLGNTRTTFIDKKEFYGPAYKLIEDTIIFIYNHLHTGMEINGIVGTTTYEIEPSIIRELLNNAVNHRSYSDESAIQVSIYDDRLEITSPGSLYSDLTIEEITSGRSKPRNKIITRIFREMGIIEEWG